MQFSNTKPRAWIALPLLGALAFPLHAGQDSTSQVVGVMQEHVGAIRALASSGENASLLGGARRARLESELARADKALAAGDWLESLRPYASVAEALAQDMIAFETDVESLEDLAVEARVLRDLLEELGSPLAKKAQRPAALQALLEDANATAWAYLVSSEEQGREASVRAGIYYLKIARGKAELVQLLAGLDFPAPLHPLTGVPGLTRYLDQLEGELLELYQPPLTQDRHATFIQLSAGLKFAREMRDKDFQLGALEQGLEVGRGLAVFPEGAGTEAHERDALRRELARWREDLERESADVSLPGTWLAEARDALADETSDLTQVGALFVRVLDDYFTCFQGDAERGSQSEPIEPTVTVTLVRWPFT